MVKGSSRNPARNVYDTTEGTLRYSTPQKNHYEVLGIGKKASNREIKTAFFKLSKECHPDTNPNLLNHDKFVRVNEAYSVLSKPLSRKEYDFSLARTVYMHQNLARNAYSAHYPGSSHAPGHGMGHNYQSTEEQERVYWDETIWHMRDKSKDRFYADDEYYGIKGIKKVPNYYIVIVCFIIMGFGCALHLLAVNHGRQISRKILDEKDKKNNAWLQETRRRARLSRKIGTEVLDRNDRANMALLNAARERARVNGNLRQIELMQLKLGNAQGPQKKEE